MKGVFVDADAGVDDVEASSPLTDSEQDDDGNSDDEVRSKWPRCMPFWAGTPGGCLMQT